MAVVHSDLMYRIYGLFVFKQKTAYEMRISDWSSDVCSSDLLRRGADVERLRRAERAIFAKAVPGDIIALFRQRKTALPLHHAQGRQRDRKSVVSGRSVSVRVDLGGRRILKKKHHESAHHRLSK